MTVKISRVRNEKGDDEMHVAGCADVDRTDKRANRSDSNQQTFEGATLLDAIKEADAEFAGWFGEEPYTQSSRDNGCWTTRHMHFAPCFAKLVQADHIVWDENYVPSQKVAEAAGGTGLCRKCKANQVAKAGWTWCRSCVDSDRAAKKLAKELAAERAGDRLN